MLLNPILQRTVIPVRRVNPNNLHHVGIGHGHVVRAGNPVFWTIVVKPEQPWRQFGHDVV